MFNKLILKTLCKKKTIHAENDSETKNKQKKKNNLREFRKHLIFGATHALEYLEYVKHTRTQKLIGMYRIHKV